MGPHRQDCLRPIVRTLKASISGGLLHVHLQGKNIASGYAIPWPTKRSERAQGIRDLIDLLDGIEGDWFVTFVKDGASPTKAHRWPWPGPLEIFASMPGPEWAPYPAWALDGLEDETEVATGRGPAVSGDSEQQPASAIKPVVLEVMASVNAQMAKESRSRYSERCAKDVLALLNDHEKRLTMDQLAGEFARRGTWSQTTVNHTLPEMRRRGDVDNARDDRGTGYGLPEWSAEPEDRQ